MRSPLYPTAEQTLTCFLQAQSLTKMYLSIFLVRQDERTGEIVILAGEETNIVIAPSGLWRFE